jgi:DNA primase
MASNSDIFKQVQAAVDIVEVIGEHIALKKAGREFKGLCPFHPDHRPSMAVVPHKQIFHCFVCGTGGDVFKFVKEFHKMSPGEALRMLAQRAGIKLPDLPPRGGPGWSGGGSGRDEKDAEGLSPRERIAATNEWACLFFEKHLRSPQGKAGLDYFHSRGLTDETIAKFRLGMSPDGWTGLVNASLRNAAPTGARNVAAGPSNEQLFEAGLIKQRQDSSPYDAFRNRVMFPIIDATGGTLGKGRVIAFGGRILEEKRDEQGNVVEAKYLNSPDSRLFNKSESLYGLNLARQQIIRTRTAIVVEGYMDVIACHQAGVTNVIATLGTALTAEHARILKNYAQAIVLVFDSDDAGRRAADRALDVFVRGTLDIRLASVPDGKDPCDFCMKNGGEPFQKLVDTATDALAYKWNQLHAQLRASDSISAHQEAITQYLRFLAPTFESGAISDPIRRGLLLTRVASLVKMKVPDLELTLRKLAQQGQSQYRPAPVPAAPAADVPGDQDAAGNGERSPGSEESPASAARRPNIRGLKGFDAAEGWLLGCLLVQPALFESVRQDLSLNLFECFRPLASRLLEFFENHDDLAGCTLPELLHFLEEEGDAELVRQTIELEDKTGEWLEPSNLSPIHTKMLQHHYADRGLSLATLLRDSLKELQSSRGTTDPAVDSDFGQDGVGDSAGTPSGPADEESAALQELQSLVNKRSTPNLRNTNFPT